MRTVHAWVLVALAAPLALAAEPSDPAVAQAFKKLEAARSAAAAAVKKIEADPPANADIDAADKAVSALKEAIDAGAKFEAKDLELAQAVLAARKEMRTQREFVDQRRANIKVHDARRALDGAMGTLKETGTRIEASGAGARDFEEARQAAAVVKKLVEENRQYGKQDPKFAGYLAEVEAAVAKHNKTIDERGLKILVEKARNELSAAFKAFNDAMGALSPQATDAQFKAADEETKALTRALEAGKDLEPKDKTYGGEAEKARTALGAGKKKMDELWTQSGLERLKAEIEPAHKELQAAAKNLKAGKPSDEHLAEAKTAAIVVKKLVEKFAPEAQRSKAFGQYVETVKATLVEVEVRLQKRALDAARADAAAALRAADKRGATKEQQAELETALTVYEKIIEATPKVADNAQSLSDGKNFIKDARASMAKRRVENARADASTALRAVEKKGVTEEQFGELNTALTVLEKTLEGTPKDPALTATVSDAKSFIKDAKATIAKRRVELEVGDQKAKVEEAKKKANEAVKELQTAKTVTPEQLKAAEDAVAAIAPELEAGKELKKKDREWGAYESDTRKRIAELNERIANRKKAQAAADLKATLQAALADTTTKIETALAPPGTDSDLDTATKAFEELTKMIDGQVNLERSDQSYAAAADRARNQTFKLLDKLQLAQMARELRRGTGEALAAGDAEAKKAEGMSDLRAKKKALDGAASQYRSCERDGRIILSRYQQAKLETKVQVLMDGQPAPPKDVVAACTSRAEKAEAGAKETVPLLAFNDGPRKAYESFKAARAKDEQLKQLNECVTTGVILGNRSPELKERKLDVAGTSLTLAELIAQCQSERKRLGGK